MLQLQLSIRVGISATLLYPSWTLYTLIASSYDFSLLYIPSPSWVCWFSFHNWPSAYCHSLAPHFPAGTDALPWTSDCLAGFLILCFPNPTHSSRRLGPPPVFHPSSSHPATEFALPAPGLLNPAPSSYPTSCVAEFPPCLRPKLTQIEKRHHQTWSESHFLICNMKGLY